MGSGGRGRGIGGVEGEGWGEWRMRARDGGVDGEGWGEWRMRVRDGGVEDEGEGWGSGGRGRGMEGDSENSNETGLVMKKKFLRPVSVPASPWTSGIKRATINIQPVSKPSTGPTGIPAGPETSVNKKYCLGRFHVWLTISFSL